CCKRFGLLEERADAPVRPCARCGHREIVVCVARQRTEATLAPLAASYRRKLKTPILTGEEEIEYDDRPDTAAPVGVFVAHVCRACGFTDWYALDPQAIPIGPDYGTELVVIEGPHPYR